MPDPILEKSSLDNLLATVGGDKAFFAEMIDIFFSDSDRQISAMKTFTEQGRTEDLRRAAHSLKSNAANFGALDLARLCKKMEELGKSNSVAGASELLSEIEAAYFKAHLALQEWR